jgi:SagB-type dehydrogenase family enzyme
MRAPDETLGRLVRMDILEEVDDDSEGHGKNLPSPWNYWGHETWHFHARAHRTVFLHDRNDIWLEKAGREEPLPERVAPYSDGDNEVGLGGFRGASALANTFASRRTTRDFADRPLPLALVGELISETFRVREVWDADYFGMVPAKSYPSAGARHEIDTYVVALKVLGIPTGIYYYDDYQDSLANTRLECDATALDACLAHQGMTETSAALLITVCHAERLAWKYRSPRGYLDAYVNVGHAMQNALLYAESLGIGTWPTTAIDTRALSSLLKLDEAEFPTSVLALGYPRDPQEVPPT